MLESEKPPQSYVVQENNISLYEFILWCTSIIFSPTFWVTCSLIASLYNKRFAVLFSIERGQNSSCSLAQLMELGIFLLTV